MENASKALLMAGGILLAILILSAFVFMFSSVKNFSASQDAKALEDQIKAFNSEYEAYNKTVMYGVDVITVINKSMDYNHKIGENEAIINIKLNLKTKNFNDTPNELSIGNKEYNVLQNSKELKDFFTSNSSNLKNFKTSIFKCTGVTYDETGRINSMTFEYRKDKNKI